MDLYKEIIVKVLEKEKAEVIFPNLQINAEEMVKLRCYDALKRIKDIIQDDSLEDEECFMKIKEIVCTFEELGSNGGTRHDFV